MPKYFIRQTINPFTPQPIQFTVYADGRPVKTGFSSIDIARRWLRHFKEVNKGAKKEEDGRAGEKTEGETERQSDGADSGLA